MDDKTAHKLDANFEIIRENFGKVATVLDNFLERIEKLEKKQRSKKNEAKSKD